MDMCTKAIPWCVGIMSDAVMLTVYTVCADTGLEIVAAMYSTYVCLASVHSWSKMDSH